MSLVLVTGASTGLGLATVHALVTAGHDVVLHARSADRVEDPAVLDTVVGAAYGDLSDLDATTALAHELDRFGRFDAVVHNAVRDGARPLRPSTLSHAVDPGWVPTRMGGVGAPDDLVEGHRTQVWLASAPDEEIDPRTAGYWNHGAPHEPHRATRDPDFQAKVLAHLAKSTGLLIESDGSATDQPQ